MCPVYINRIASIHAESRNEKPYFSAQEPDYKEMITNANLRRRMSRMIKMGVACGLECLKDIPSEKVDAIITATGLGCLADTEKFMNALMDNREQMLNPTAFIQSTFNTVGAQLALLLKIHAYNVTYVHRGLSFESALIDGIMSIAEHPELMIDWFPVLGNHEYRGNTQAVLDYTSISRRWTMPARYYTKVFEDKGTTIRIVWIDTAPMMDKYRNDSATYPDACKQDLQKQLSWIDSVLTSAKEDWIIVAGHHPIYAETSKDDSERLDMQKRLDPILRKHKVDMYICGHIHNFQHIRRPGSDIDYIVNSAGSLARKVKPTEGTVFCNPEPGFSVVSADKKELTLRMIDKKGNILHTISRKK